MTVTCGGTRGGTALATSRTHRPPGPPRPNHKLLKTFSSLLPSAEARTEFHP